MKLISISLIAIALLATAPRTHAWLGDTEDQLIQRYGKPRVIQATTGDIPTQKGYYAELRENLNTNVSLVTTSGNNYNMDLVELRPRYWFEKDGQKIAVYIGNPGEKYDKLDFSGKSAREVFISPVTWQTNRNKDRVAHPLPFTPATLKTILQNNKGNSTWMDHLLPGENPGTYILRTTDNTRMAIGNGPSTNEIYRLEVRMASDDDRFTGASADPLSN